MRTAAKPLVWDEATGRAVPFDTAGAVPALLGRYHVSGAISVDADDARREFGEVEGATAFAKLVAHMGAYSPEWAAKICDVPAATIRRIANEYLESACIGETIEIDGDDCRSGRWR